MTTVQWARRRLVAVAAGTLLAFPALAAAQNQPAWMKTPLTDAAVDKAVQRGIDYLWQARNPDEGHWESWTLAKWKQEVAKLKGQSPAYNGPGCYSGGTALALLALHKAGVSQDDERFDKAVKFILPIEPTQTYARGLRAALFASLNRPKTYRVQMEKEKRWLLDALYADGSYGYYAPPDDKVRMNPSGTRDHSNTQYGILGLWLLTDTGIIEAPLKYWQVVQAGYLRTQCADGGWNYSVSPNQPKSSESMTLAGLASLFIVWDRLYTARCEQAVDPALERSVERGLDWMAKNFQIGGNTYIYYTLYGIERVGVAGGLKYFGEKNWWDVGARYVLATQNPDGSWGGGTDDYYRHCPVNTAWALLFLSYGRAPVVINKLDYARPAQWNSRPRDLVHLTGWMGKTYERLFNWQVTPISRPLEELLEAPILLMSGKGAIELKDPDKQKLKQYVLRGGLLLAEAAGGSLAFDRSFRQLCGELFGELELTPLPKDHPIYTLEFKLNKVQAGSAAPPPLEGIRNGIRTLVVYSPKDLGCAWQGNEVIRSRSYFELGANLVQYVSDRFTGLVGRGTSYAVIDRGHRPERTVTIGRLVWGGKYQWDPEPAAWRQVDVTLRNARLMGVQTRELDFAAAVDPANVPVVHLTGVGRLQLGEAAKANLKKYVADGGLLLADAAGGNKDFADSFAKLAEELFGRLAPVLPPFAREAAPDGKVALRHVDGLPRAIRPLAILGHLPGPDARGVLFLRDDLTAALAGYPNVEPVGLTPQAAVRFVTALLKWRFDVEAEESPPDSGQASNR